MSSYSKVRNFTSLFTLIFSHCDFSDKRWVTQKLQNETQNERISVSNNFLKIERKRNGVFVPLFSHFLDTSLQFTRPGVFGHRDNMPTTCPCTPVPVHFYPIMSSSLTLNVIAINEVSRILVKIINVYSASAGGGII